MKKTKILTLAVLLLAVVFTLSSALTAFAGIVAEDDDTYTVRNLGIPSDAVYFGGHYYYYYDDAESSWSMARNICFIYGGHLVSITSREEQAFLEKSFPGTQGWIGASVENGTWKWSTGEPFSYSNWKEGEPNNQNGQEGYAHLYTGMQWNDLPQDDTTYHRGFYCEWDSDTLTYERDGLFGNDVSYDTRELLERGKDFLYGLHGKIPDAARAWDCFDEATDDYSGEAWYYIASILAEGITEEDNRYMRAYGAYERAVNYGCLLGWYGMGDMFRLGQGVETDYEKALTLYQRATALGCTEAYTGIGYLFELGQGVEKDEEKAFACFERAAKTGYMYALDALADCYYFGIGTSVDYRKAFDYYREAAEKGSAYSMYSLGWMYENGEGTQKDTSLAKKWYQKFLDSPHGSLEMKESVGEEMAWLASEESASAFDGYSYDYPQGLNGEYDVYNDYYGPYTSDYDYPQGLNGEYSVYNDYYGPYTSDYDYPQGLNGEYGVYEDYYGPYTSDYDYPQGLNGEYGVYNDYYGPYTSDYDYPQGINGEYDVYEQYYGQGVG